MSVGWDDFTVRWLDLNRLSVDPQGLGGIRAQADQDSCIMTGTPQPRPAFWILVQKRSRYVGVRHSWQLGVGETTPTQG